MRNGIRCNIDAGGGAELTLAAELVDNNVFGGDNYDDGVGHNDKGPTLS